jgi:hypothetical protein
MSTRPTRNSRVRALAGDLRKDIVDPIAAGIAVGIAPLIVSLREKDEEHDEKLAELEGKVGDFDSRIDERFVSHGTKVDERIEERFNDYGTRFDEHGAAVADLTARVEALEKPDVVPLVDPAVLERQAADSFRKVLDSKLK